MQKVLASVLDVYKLHFLRMYKADEYEQGERLSWDEIRKILYSDAEPGKEAETVSNDGKYTARGEGGRADLGRPPKPESVIDPRS